VTENIPEDDDLHRDDDRYIEYEHNKLVLHTFFQKIENLVLGAHSLCIMLSIHLFSRDNGHVTPPQREYSYRDIQHP
jgi:hypothetical protein